MENAGHVPAFFIASNSSRIPHVYSSSTFRAVLSPCVGVCRLDDLGLCVGCRRTTGEIARWGQMGDDERLRLMEVVLPMREPTEAA